MTNVLITNAVILTCDGNRSVIEHATIAVADNRIAAVGASSELEKAYPGFERFDARGLAVLPGFINAHTHTALTVLRGTVEDWDGNAVDGYMSPVSYEMSDEERAIMVQLGCLEAIRSGCATLVDPFRHLPSYVDAMAYALWGILLKYNPVSKVAIYGFTNPVIGVLLSALLLGEGGQAFSVKNLLALLCVCIGIIVVNLWKRQGEAKV